MRFSTLLGILIVLQLPTTSSGQAVGHGSPFVKVEAARSAEEFERRSVTPLRDSVPTRSETSSAYQPQPKGTFTVRNGIGILHDDGTMYTPGKALGFGSGVTYTYTPSGPSHYSIAAGALLFEDPSGGQTIVAGDNHPQTPSADLSFVLADLGLNFQIGNSTYSKAYVSRTGVIVFSNSGQDLKFHVPIDGRWDFDSGVPVRNWGPTVAVLAEPFDYLEDASISIRKSPDHATITWTNVRSRHSSIPNTFQAKLYQDGSVWMSYKALSLDHGGVGIYSGISEEHVVASSGPSSAPTGPSYLGIQKVSYSLLGESFLKVDIQTAEPLPTGGELAPGESYGFALVGGNLSEGILVLVQNNLVNGVPTGSGIYSVGAWSLVKYLGSVADSTVLSGNNISFVVPVEVLAALGNPQNWWITSYYKGLRVTDSAQVLFPSINANRELPNPGQPSQIAAASTFDHYTSVLNPHYVKEALVARLGRLDIDNYYYFPLHYSGSLPHWMLAATSAKRTNVTGLGQIDYFNDGGCDCHWGIEFQPPSELLLSGEIAYYPLSHEIAHQWVFYANHLDSAGASNSDWRSNAFSCTSSAGAHLGDRVQNMSMFQNALSGSLSLPSRSVMGGTARGADGQKIPYQLFGFSPLELYLMGLATPQEVSPIQSYDFPGKALTPITIESVIAANGPRLPAYDGSTKTIRVPIVIVVPQNEDIDDATLNSFGALIESWKERFARETGGRALIDSSMPATIGKVSQTIGAISFTPSTLAVGGTTTASATATSSLAVAFSSTSPSVCTVSGNTLTGISAGTCTIAADQSGNATYSAATQVTQNIAVSKVSQTIGAISFTPSTLAVGGTTTASATATSALAVAFSSTTPTICSVAGATVTGLAAGTCTIAADQAGNATYAAASQVLQSFAVNSLISQTISFTNPGAKTLGAAPFALSATGGASGNAVTFTSQTASICTVVGSTVTLVAAGTCTIAANQAGNASYAAASQVLESFAVNKASQSIGAISFNPPDEAVGVPISSNIVVTFSQPIQRGTGNIVLKNAASAVVETFNAASSIRLSISGAALTINPTANLNWSAGYKVEFDAGTVKDLIGNSYAGTTNYNFTTTSEPNESEIEKLYIAYFNRPADLEGLAYWAGLLANGVSMTTIQNSFSSSAEYQAIYSGQQNTTLIAKLYQNLFGRQVTVTDAGVLWWANEMAAGRHTITTLAGALSSGTTPGSADNIAIIDKIVAASEFTDALETTLERDGYVGAAAFAIASNWLATVRDDATLAAAMTGLNATIAAAVAHP